MDSNDNKDIVNIFNSFLFSHQNSLYSFAFLFYFLPFGATGISSWPELYPQKSLFWFRYIIPSFIYLSIYLFSCLKEKNENSILWRSLLLNWIRLRRVPVMRKGELIQRNECHLLLTKCLTNLTVISRQNNSPPFF